MTIKTLGLAAALLATTATGALAEVKFALSTSQNATDPLAIAMEEAAVRIEERTNGEIDVTVYPSSQLGSDNDVLEQIRNGAAIAVLVDAGRLAPFKQELGILSAPYLVEDWTQYAAITASEPYLEWVEDLADTSGLRLLNYNWFQGTRQMFTTNPVTSAADLAGVRVRTIDAPGWLATVNAMGATAVPMAWSEVYSALQLGAIDGAEAQLTGAYGIKLHEVTGNLAFTNHVQLVTGLTTSEAWFSGLTPEQQAIVSEELAQAGDDASAATVAKGEEVLAEMKAGGMTVNEVDPEEFRELTAGVYAELGLEEARAALQPFIDAAKP
ncbi:C4-dicarboxylate ABC transporter [Frigidibacter albus]|uniref:C4-dicarboxylate ABC transporter n=1 Tax=Frigidibacter albus TaxID=1465486 RepID=A0A6L8VGD5_9RHOB|nr:C4-dicarboxylate TRAP transporter substrate-binding protein [Frigidibacter albus]MZQ88781.1 C4-dicarboxylate ABC transporter [Frigidibacter albus]NBE30410.1 C4-dicarboxylate ABC transporter [Frigidibacter albus]GGH50449.1 C4-dicarboxylate ABC transporter [Frigidibacter albus]